MQCRSHNRETRRILAIGAFLLSMPLFAADYYVATTGSDDNDGSSEETPFATIDKAITTATSSEDVIHVAAGTYSTTTEWGPSLAAKLVGEGATRADVVIQPAGSYRTLRMAANSWLENVMVEGNADITKVDKGGAIEMNGGTITNCVVRGGTAYGYSDNKNAGGNLYVNSDAALVVDCEISGGTAKNRGGNVCLDHGTLRDCTITGGSVADGSENNGGNVWTYVGKIENCTISGGSAVLGGNVFVHNANASLTGGTISGGTATQYGGNVYLREGTMSGATVSGGTMAEVSSGNYGGGNVYADGNSVVSECVILDGSAYRRGGNVYAVGGATVKNCAITNGTCSANIGGNIYMEAATVTNSTVYGGSASSRGGNIFLNNAASLVVDCTVENGNAGTQGGNLYVNAGAVSSSTIANGTSVTDGGNVFMAASTVVSDCVISNGTIVSTHSAWDGPKGVNVNLNGASAKLLRCHVVGGTTTPLKDDGSFYYDRGSVAVNNPSAIIDNCLVEGCACGGVAMQSNGYIYNSTVVKNARYGYWAWNNNQHVYNTVIYGNTGNEDANTDYTGNMPNGDTAAFLNNAVTESGSRHTTSAYPTVVLLADDSAFADYANGDYRPAAGSALIDAGGVDPRGAAASATDLDGNPRQSGTVDIGCYEYQKPDMTVRIDEVALDQAFAPAVVTFTHAVDNSTAPDTVVFAYDFGDGTSESNISESSVSHTYSTPGIYTVKITATNTDVEESAEMTYDGYVRVASSTVYVTPGTGSGTYPYNTPETGFASLKSAVEGSVDGSTLVLEGGVYETASEIVVDKAISIVGSGATPESVIVRNTVQSNGHRTMQVNNAGAFVSNLTIEDGYNSIGANLRLVTGVVSNCVIRGGTAVASSNGAGAGVELAGAATLTHCVVSNNVVQGTSSDGGMTGGAIYFPYNSKNGHVSNCLVAYNRYVTSGEAVKSGAAGIRFFGSNNESTVENCTIVANTVEGTLTEDSAGIYCTSWYVRFRNNIVVGNSETGKDGYSGVKINENCTVTSCLFDVDATPSVLFKNFAKGDFRLMPKCLAYDYGTQTGLALTPSVDILGKPRVFGKRIDIGCYESQQVAGFVVRLR